VKLNATCHIARQAGISAHASVSEGWKDERLYIIFENTVEDGTS